MKSTLKTITQKLRATSVMFGAMAIAVLTVANVSGASAAPGYFDVDKGPMGPGQQTVCYTQAGGIGWKAAGFKNLDHCLRYVSTGEPENQEACEDGWWYVYGFNTQAQCKEWVVLNGGGGYGGTL